MRAVSRRFVRQWAVLFREQAAPQKQARFETLAEGSKCSIFLEKNPEAEKCLTF
jgi:hypothetical protein